MSKLLEQLNNLKELGYIQKGHLNILEVTLEEHNKEIRDKAIDEFVAIFEKMDSSIRENKKEGIKPIFIIENIREIAEHLKAGVNNE